MSPKVLIVKTGAAMESLRARRGDYEDWIAAGLRGPAVEVVDVQGGDELPDPRAHPLLGVVVTGSSAMVTDRAPWSVRAGAWLEAVLTRGTPILAICFGHQLLADARGGEVAYNEKGREMGSITVNLTEAAKDDPLFAELPRTLRVSASHRQHVRRLPEGAVRLAENPKDAAQAYRLGARAWGVQFHPEWDHDVIRAYLEARVDTLRSEGLDPDALLREVTPSDHGERLLARFGALV